MRSFQGRASEELYNEALSQLYNWLTTLHHATEPSAAIEGALWVDANNTLNVKRNGKFVPLSESIYQSMAETLSAERPTNPKVGQLWLNENKSLTYYDGVSFMPVKAELSDAYSMDSFEPFLIIEALHAGANEIIKKESNVIEEEFVAYEGATEFFLQKGQYATMQNKLVVYINGRIMPKQKYLEVNSSTVKLITPLKKGEHVMLHYISKDAAQDTTYVPLKFHPALREEIILIEEATHTFSLSHNCVTGKENMMLYINGRFVGQRYYTIENNRDIHVVAELEPNEEILVQYIDALLYESVAEQEIQISEELPYTQYIWPSSDYDRLFMNGKLALDYETLNKITIQYPSRVVQGKSVSAVHVHPKNLIEIKKRVYAINKNDNYLQADERNTEFYAIMEMPTDASDLEEAPLYPDRTSNTAQISDGARSYILYVSPSTQYRITRSVASDVFIVSEYSIKPAIGAHYSTYLEVEDVANLSEAHDFVTGPNTYYILIQVGDGGVWAPPIIETNAMASKSKLLVKTQQSDTDYTSVVGGIQLSHYIKNTYDYILAITYVFGDSSGRGHLEKVSFDLIDDSQIILGNISDPLLVFAQGHYLISDNNYTYNEDSGKLTLLFPERLDIGVLTFPKYESGVILEKDKEGNGILFIQKHMVKPIVFVYGQHMQQMVDYTQVGNLLRVKDAEIDMHYAIVDCVDDYGNSMFLGEGDLLYDDEKKLFYAPALANFDDAEPILFVNGLLLNKNDLFFENNKLYLLRTGHEGMRYLLLRDHQHRFLHSDIKEANTFATDVGANQGLFYVDGNILGDIEAFGCMHLPDSGYQREIKGIMHYDTQAGYVIDEWYIYSGDSWIAYTNDAQKDKLKKHLAHYILEDKRVHFTHIESMRNKKCHAWLYMYDQTIEYPLEASSLEMRDDTLFRVLPAHGYLPNQNCLSVYIDGYRQYPQTIDFLGGVKEIDTHTFEISAPVPESRLDYIIERPERDEAKSCLLEVLTSDAIYGQTLKTTVPLLPGFIDLFIDGIRQPCTSFEAASRYSIVLDTFTKDPRYTNHILIEVRQDFNLKEANRVIEKDGLTQFECVDDMKSLLTTRDFIKIYVNGVYVGDEYDMIRENGTISIPKIDTLGFAIKGHVVSFVWR